MTRGSGRGRRGFSVLAVLLPLLALISLTSWAFSSPAGSSPDEDFHLTSIWCATGDKADACQTTADPAQRIVPRALVAEAECYAAHSAESAACQGSSFGTHPNSTVETSRGNFTGLYPPVFYLAMSPFVGADVSVSVLTMRVVNSALFVGMMTVLCLLLPVRQRRGLLWAAIVTTVPLGLFLIASVNPSGWAVTSAATLLIALVGYFRTSGRQKAGLAGMAVLATVIGAGARADSAAYAGIALVVAVILSFSPSRRFWVSCLLPVVLGIVAVGFFLSAGQSLASSTGLGVGRDTSIPVASLIMTNLLNVPDLWIGVFGRWPLGWIDTVLPGIVYVAGFLSFCGSVFLGLRSRSWRKGLGLGLILLAVWLIPTVLLVKTTVVVGEGVQPRYILPLIVLLAGVALVRLEGRDDWHASPAQRVLLIVALSIAQAVALHTNLRRYVTGVDVGGANLDSAREWWWNIPVTPMGVWVIGSVSFTMVLIVAAILESRERPSRPRKSGWRPSGQLPTVRQPSSVSDPAPKFTAKTHT